MRVRKNAYRTLAGPSSKDERSSMQTRTIPVLKRRKTLDEVVTNHHDRTPYNDSHILVIYLFILRI